MEHQIKICVVSEDKQLEKKLKEAGFVIESLDQLNKENTEVELVIFNEQVLELDRVLKSESHQFYFVGVPMVWFPEKDFVTDKELIYCYEKNIDYVPGKLDSSQVLFAKIKNILGLQLVHISLEEDLSSQSRRRNEFMQKVYQYLSENMLQHDFSIEKLGEDLGLSKTCLYSTVKKLTGNSPSKMVIEFRLKKALHLLQNTEDSISEIAYKVGFSSPAYFTKCFREQYGLRPSDQREKLLNHEERT